MFGDLDSFSSMFFVFSGSVWQVKSRQRYWESQKPTTDKLFSQRDLCRYWSPAVFSCLHTCGLDIGPVVLILKAELEALPLRSIIQSTAVLDSCAYNSLLTLTVDDHNKRNHQLYTFQCEQTGVSHMTAELWLPGILLGRVDVSVMLGCEDCKIIPTQWSLFSSFILCLFY